jgi:hypothetical protein
MINEEEKFNDLLRSKLSEREFFFDELNWEKAEKALIKEENARKRKRVAIIFAGGFLLGAMVMFPLANLLSNKQSVTASIETKGSNNNSAVAANDRQPGTQANSASANNSVPNASANAEVQHNPSVQENSASTNNESVKNKQSVAQQTTSANQDNSKPVSEKKHKKHSVALAVANNQQTASNNYDYVRPTSERKHKKHATTLVTTNGQQTTSSNNTYANTQPSNVNSTAPDNKQESGGNANNSQTGSQNTTPTQTTATTPTQGNTGTALTGNSGNQVPDSSHKSTPPVTANPSNTPSLFPEQKPAKSNKPSSSSTVISVEAGGGYSFGWKIEESNKAGNGFSPLAGVSLLHNFSEKIGLYVGVRYQMLTNINSSYSSSSGSYDFGVNSTVTSVNTQLLHYIAAPLGLQYNFDDKNALRFGGTILYLLNTSSQVTTATQDGVKPVTSQKKSSLGYTDGFNTLDAQLIIAYRRRLFKAFDVSAEAHYGLMDIENNSFFNSSTFQRNSGIRLVLSYDIIK